MMDFAEGSVADSLTGTVALSQREFDDLPDYSCTLPTGKTVGKRWRRREPYQTGPGIVNEWFMGEYQDDPEPGWVAIRWYRIKILTARESQVRDRLRQIRTEGGCEGCGALPTYEHADYCPVYIDNLRRSNA